MDPEMSGVWGGERICLSLERQIWDLVTLQFVCLLADGLLQQTIPQWFIFVYTGKLL